MIEQLPSGGTDPAALGNLAADAKVVKQAVERAGEPVVLVGHSYGGMVVTELADYPAVAHTVYLAAFWPQRGQSAMDLFAAGPQPTWVSPHDDGTARTTDDLELLRQTLCADVDEQHAYAYLCRFLPQSIASATAPSTAPDRGHPTTYIICEQDRVHRRGIKVRIARGGVDSSTNLGRYHWFTERTISWLLRFKRLGLRYDRTEATLAPLLTLVMS